MTSLSYVEEGQAGALFRALNERYFAFVEGLPPPLQPFARRRSTYLGAAAQGDLAGMEALNPVLVATPWLFWPSFKDLEEERFLSIAESGACYVLASILLDHLVDGQGDPAGWMPLFQNALYAHGRKGYQALFSPQEGFWQHYRRLEGDHQAGLALELQMQSQPLALDLEALARSAHGKVSPIVITLAALTEASGQPALLAPLERSLKCIAVASQLLDDIGDWAQDLEAGHLTFHLRRLAPERSWRGEDWPVRAELEERLASEWVDVDHLELVLDWLERALQALEGVACPAWQDYVGGYQRRAQEHLKRAYARHLKVALGPMVKSRPGADSG